ncbi:hypothetical protein BUALT_Bualt03G0211100 [Buddleja alternifolia]|uniref:Uncharacterized protein n=1 Tax=Buddleja alternifolia TaxID=168488 RepID=A0AAV6Y2U5_9LAMI|nr:hypothetical protein BUALT_Bualt03G0211100 [Buddleja alternifolia]
MSSRSKKRKTNTTPVVDEFKFFLKAMINKERTKVLFLEVDSDFADVLLSFLTLPLGTIVRILEKHYRDKAVPVFGSLNTLRKGLKNVNSCTWRCSEMLLHPRNSFEEECRKLKVNVISEDHMQDPIHLYPGQLHTWIFVYHNVDDTEPTRYFTCGDLNCKKEGYLYVSVYYGAGKCDHCGQSLSIELSIRETNTGVNDGGVFTRKMSFLISDDLQIMPNVPASIIQTLRNLGISGTDGVELWNMCVGFSEIMDLLKVSLFSETPLTDVILNKGHEMDSATVNSEQGISPHQMETNTSPNSKKIIVKAMIQKSTNKLLFIQAEEDFVDFLFSFLTIPLGGVVGLLGSKTFLGSVDNFYRSIENLDSDKHMKNPGTKEGLLKPMLPPMYGSENQIFPINERTPTLYYYPNYEESTEFASHSPEIIYKDTKNFEDETENGSLMCFKDPRRGRSFIKGPEVFLVTDDLNVVSSSMGSKLVL